LTVTGASSADATATGSAFILTAAPSILDSTHALASFSFHSDAAQSGTVVLGDLVASVPNSAAGTYKSKELLSLDNVTVNGEPFTGMTANGVHVNAYLGDVTGNGAIDGLDLATANQVAQGNATGFAAYGLLDPAIIADPANDLSVDAGDVSTLAAFTAHVKVPTMPAIPAGLTIVPQGADPTLSLVGGLDVKSGTLPVTVVIDNPHPQGSTGMTEAVLALTYDPSVLSISAADIALGSISAEGTGWQLSSVIDQTRGQIAITLYSQTPITTSQACSLITITFHVQSGERRGGGHALPLSSVRLVSPLTLDGQEFTTQVDDTQGPLVLTRGADGLSMGVAAARPVRRVSRGA
jgi:hypothetical protein